MTEKIVKDYGLPVHTIKSAEGQYNEPGLPTPPAGYGRKIGFTDSVDGDDMGPESRDEH